MLNTGINTRMCWWLYFVVIPFDLIETQSTIGGGGFLADPFLELTAGVTTTPATPKSSKSDTSCVSNGALAGSIIGTLIMSAFVGFLAWLIYIRPKFKELHESHLYKSRRMTNVHQPHLAVSSSSSIPNHKQSSRKQQIDDDHNVNQLPLDVTDYKFGTFPFRQSQISSINGHYNRNDWLNRISCSFRSVNIDQNFEMVDVELLDPTFGGLNFSITGNMRAGIFVKEILDKGLSSARQTKQNPSEQLKTGDRIMALTVCFESIVYEDALTILSYASPYPVILRVQRPLNPTKMNVTTEKRPTTANTTSKVKWRDDFEHYDNDTPLSRSFVQPNPSSTVNHLPPTPSNTKTPSSPPNRSSSKKTRSNANTQPRATNKSSSTSKSNKLKTSSNSVLATSGATTKRSNSDAKKHQSKTNNHNQRALTNQPMLVSTGLTGKPSPKITTPPTSTNKKPVKSVADAVISYLHYKGGSAGGGVEHTTEVINNPEATMMPYYDSPYDYYYGGQASQYQYLHQSQLNKNNNNSLSTESLTAVTPNLASSVYTIQLSTSKTCLPKPRRYERRLSSPAAITTERMERITVNDTENEPSINVDTFV